MKRGDDVKVKELNLTNFRGIHDLTFSFSDRMNVLVGVNGVGKTSVLDAIAILLSRLIWRIRSNKSTGRQFNPNDVKKGEKQTSNTITISIDGQDVSWTVGKQVSKTKKQTITNLDDLTRLVSDIHDKLEQHVQFNIPLAVYYSVNRAVLDVPLRIRKTHIFDPLAAYDHALSGQRTENDFRIFFEWFRNREDLENENRRYKDSHLKPENWEFPDRQLEAVRKALSLIMPDFNELQVQRNPLHMVVNKKGHFFEIDQLSDGEKTLLAMVGDLARRLALANPYLDNPLDGEGVVMIDELDLHLHPAWQRMILPRLCETFKNCQFIVSTHSPQVLGEVDPDHVWLLYQDNDTMNISCSKPTQMYGLSSSDILEDWMNSRSINEDVDQQYSEIFSLIDDEKYMLAREKIGQLRAKLHGSTPDLIRAESLITMLEPDHNKEAQE